MTFADMDVADLVASMADSEPDIGLLDVHMERVEMQENAGGAGIANVSHALGGRVQHIALEPVDDLEVEGDAGSLYLVGDLGAIARIYEELGGKVHWIGKPYREIYMLAISRWTNAEPGGIVCIGDSIEHDIKGAGDMGLASVLVRTGILATASEQELAELTRRHHAVPTYLLPCFSVDAA